MPRGFTTHDSSGRIKDRMILDCLDCKYQTTVKRLTDKDTTHTNKGDVSPDWIRLMTKSTYDCANCDTEITLYREDRSYSIFWDSPIE